MGYPPLFSERFGAGDDLDQLLGDHRLARAVIGDRLLLDHLARIAGCIVHGAHLRAVERRIVFEKRTQKLYRDVARQKLSQDARFIWLVVISDGLVGRRDSRHLGGNETLGGRDLRDHRSEGRVEQRTDIEATALMELADLLADEV